MQSNRKTSESECSFLVNFKNAKERFVQMISLMCDNNKIRQYQLL